MHVVHFVFLAHYVGVTVLP